MKTVAFMLASLLVWSVAQAAAPDPAKPLLAIYAQMPRPMMPGGKQSAQRQQWLTENVVGQRYEFWGTVDESASGGKKNPKRYYIGKTSTPSAAGVILFSLEFDDLVPGTPAAGKLSTGDKAKISGVVKRVTLETRNSTGRNDPAGLSSYVVMTDCQLVSVVKGR